MKKIFKYVKDQGIFYVIYFLILFKILEIFFKKSIFRRESGGHQSWALNFHEKSL